jgi:hypothetical protein
MAVEPFSRVDVVATLDNYKMVHWYMNPEFQPVGDIDFYVDRARSGGDWERIAGPITNDCFYTDTQKLNYNKDRDTYYRITFHYEHISCFSPPAQLGTAYANRHDWTLVRDMARKEYLDLKKYGGQEGLFLRRRRWGVKCTQCLDHDTEAIGLKDCSECLGTGIKGGYYPPIKMWIKSLELPKTGKTTDLLGTTQMPDFTAKTVAYPWFESFDVWVDTRTYQRYIIRDIQHMAEYGGIAITVVMRLSPVAAGNSEVLYRAETNAKTKENPAPAGTSNNWRPKIEMEY